jgi:outer membrane protein assembly factor BamB
MLAVVWGDAPNDVRVWNAWSHHRALAEGVTPPEPNDVFYALARGVLYAFAPEGRLLWARRLGVDSRWLPGRIDLAPPAILAVSTEDNTLVALHETTGKLRWKYRLGQDVEARPTIVRRAETPDGPRRDCALLPTADGEIHALELVLGRPLGRYRVGPPLTVGGAYDARTGLVFFAADTRRVFAIDPAAIDNADRPACRAVLFTQHAGGAIRGTPQVVGRCLIVAEDAGVETTRLRAYAVARSAALEPTAPPRNSLTVPGWSWFEPHCTPDRLTLVTDQGHVGMFGLNLDDADGSLYRLVPDWNVEEAPGARPLAVHAEDHRVWLLAGGSLQQLAVDVRGQQVRPVWKRPVASPPRAAVPVHEAQTDRFARRFYLATMWPSGRVVQFTAVDAETGRGVWHRQLGLNLLGDPVVEEDGVLLVDRSGRALCIGPQGQQCRGGPLPEAADEAQLMRLADSGGTQHLAVPCEDGKRLAICRVSPGRTGHEEGWRVLALPDRMGGSPCVCGDFVVVPCVDGRIHRIRWKGDRTDDPSQVSFRTAAADPSEPIDLVALSDAAILAIQRRRLRRLELQTADRIARWKQVGGPFEPDGRSTRLAGEPLAVDGRLYLFDTSGALYCVDAADPARRLARWELDVDVTRGPVLRDGRLIAVSDDRRLVCLAARASPEVEQPLWITEPVAGRIRGMPVTLGDTLLVADTRRTLSGIRLSDGSRAWSLRLESRAGPSATPVPCADGKVLVPQSDGTLQLVNVPSPQPAEREE